jgi:hypothetical protein
MPTLTLRAFLRAPLQRGRASQSLACDRSGERDAHHIDDTNSACSAGATRRQHRDVLAHTGAIALEESEGRKKLRSPLLARHGTANLLQNASSKSMHERWCAARLSLQLSAPCVARFRRRVRCTQSPEDATSIHIARERTQTTRQRNSFPFFRGPIVILLILTMIGGFQIPLDCIGGSSFATLRDAAAGHICRHVPA